MMLIMNWSFQIQQILWFPADIFSFFSNRKTNRTVAKGKRTTLMYITLHRKLKIDTRRTTLKSKGEFNTMSYIGC